MSVKKGNSVKVHYTGKFEDGTVFDSSVEKEPLSFTPGNGELIAGFEKAVLGMNPGDKKTETIAANDAYGEHKKDLLFVVDKKLVPEHITPEVGMQLEVTQKDGTKNTVTIFEVSENNITLDANHPLAGKTLIFEIELVEVD